MRHVLSLDRIVRVSDRLAAILATHAGVTLSLRGLKEASGQAIARLKATPSVELSRRHDAESATPHTPLVGAAAVRHQDRRELVRLLTRIGRCGEAALRMNGLSSEGSA